MRLLPSADAMAEFDGATASVTVQDVIRLRQALPGVHEITTSPSAHLELPTH